MLNQFNISEEIIKHIDNLIERASAVKRIGMREYLTEYYVKNLKHAPNVSAMSCLTQTAHRYERLDRIVAMKQLTQDEARQECKELVKNGYRIKKLNRKLRGNTI